MRAAPLSGRLQAGAHRCERLFDRHGDKAVFLGRLVPLARSFISLPAGIAAMPIGRFIAFSVAGCAIWSAGFVVAGMLGAAAA